MKKVAVVIATVFAVAAVTVGIAAAGNGGTVVDEGFACGVLDGNGDVFSTDDSTLTVYENSHRAVLRCSGWGAPAATLTYFNYENTEITCGSEFGSTTNWTDKVGRSGNSQLTCIFDLRDNQPDRVAGGSAGLG
jgi:hypothetical protein